jgi:glycosyltransferase involved in cell wall biosynthesis
LHQKKQPEVALGAFAAVCRGDKDATLVFVGPGDERYTARLQETARRLGIVDQVFFLGPLWGDAVQEAFRAATVFVLPSLQENFGLAVAEAMGAGCPVIVSDQVDLAPEIATARAGLVVRPTVDATAGALRAVLSDGVLRDELAKNGELLVQGRFTWGQIVANLSEVYQDVISGRRRSPAWRSDTQRISSKTASTL